VNITVQTHKQHEEDKLHHRLEAPILSCFSAHYFVGTHRQFPLLVRLSGFGSDFHELDVRRTTLQFSWLISRFLKCFLILFFFWIVFFSYFSILCAAVNFDFILYYNLLLCFIYLEIRVRLICAIKFYLLIDH